MNAPLYSKAGKKQKDVELNAAVFGVRVNKRLLALVDKAFAANLRHGTAATKTRKDVRGGGKKPWKQKGTGRARAGSIRSPIWRGGGTVFGPHPRSYYVNLPRGMKKKALLSALSLRASENGVILLESVQLEHAKTKELVKLFSALPVQGKSTLCIVKDFGESLKRASRNMRGWVRVRKASDINAYHVLRKTKLIIEEGALPELEKSLIESENGSSK